MSKVYVGQWKARVEPPEERHKVDVWFCSRAESAATFDTKESAQYDRALLQSFNVTIDVPNGLKQHCEGFAVEQWSDQFVIFCEAPFPGHEPSEVGTGEK